jgi:hypothetical protein
VQRQGEEEKQQAGLHAVDAEVHRLGVQRHQRHGEERRDMMPLQHH